MVFHKAVHQITIQIFEKLDGNSLKRCREVSKSWKNTIDCYNILWDYIVKKNEANNTLQLAIKKGHTKIVQMLIQKPADFNIDWQARDADGSTLLHLACWYDQPQLGIDT